MSGRGAVAGETEILAEGRFLRFNRRNGFEYVDRIGCMGVVTVVAVTPADELLLVEQYRPPVEANVIELVAGLAGDDGEETFEEAARRELLEEAGYEAGHWAYIMSLPTAAGLASPVMHCYYARDLRRVHAGGGTADEALQVHAVPLDAVFDWLSEQNRSGRLIDPKTYFGLMIAQDRRRQSG